MKSFIVFLTLLLLSGFAPSSFCQETTQTTPSAKTIFAGSEDSYPPFCTVTSTHQADGFSVELLRAALNAVGYEVAFNVDVWMKVKEALADGNIQVLPLVGRTPEREEEFDFSFPYLTMHGTIVVRDDEQDIRSYADLRGKRVAVMAQDNAEEFLRRTDFGATVITTETFEKALSDLSLGQYDAVVVQKLVALQLMQRLNINNLITVGAPAESFEQSFCFAVKKGDSHLLGFLNEGLSIVIADGTFHRLYAKWFAPIDLFEQQNLRISIGCETGFPPYAFLDEDGLAAGFNVELTHAIGRAVGMSVQVLPASLVENQSRLADGKINLILGRAYSPERDRTEDFSAALSVISQVIVSRIGGESLEDLTDLKDKSILVAEGDIMQEVAVDFGLADNLTLVENQEKALQLLAAGDHDCALVARIPALFWIEKHQWNNLALSVHSISSVDYCFAANDGNEALLAKFSEGLAALKATGEYRQIYAKWLGVYEQPTVGWTAVLKYLLIFIIPALLLLMASLIWSRTLQGRVNARTRELQGEIEVRKSAVQAHKLSEDKLRTTLDSIGDAVIATDTDGMVTRMNPVAATLTGWTSIEATGKPINDVLHIIDFQTGHPLQSLVTEVLQADSVIEVGSNTMLLSKDGSRHHISNTGAPIRDTKNNITGIVLVFRDITEEFHIQEEFHKMKRLESLGVLAGGIAHDFNNILTLIFGNISLAKSDLSSDEPGFNFLQDAENSMERARLLTSQLLTFAKGGAPVTEDISIEGLIEEIVSFDLSGSKVKAVFEIQKGLFFANVDKGQMQQVFSNLTVNSKEAMPDGGHLHISLRNKEIKNSDISGLVDGNYIEVQFRDKGIGIPEDNLRRIFDPYFSTKGSGNGLGLATTYSIIKKHSGFVFAESIVGQGTTITIYLPQTNKTRTSEVAETTRTTPSLPAASRILVMDDEDMICSLAVAVLSKKGFRVDTAPEGRQAVQMYSDALKNGDPYQITIMDLTVPGGVGGQIAATEILNIHPAAKLIVSSGYADDPVMANFGAYGFKGVIAKPYSSEVLLYSINKTMTSQEL